MSVSLRGRFRGFLAASLVAISLAAPLSAYAATGGGGPYSNGATVSIASASFESKLLVTVTLDVSCDPFVERDWNGTPTGNTTVQGRIGGIVDLMQAQGRTIAHASGYLTIDPMTQGGMPVTCDGSTFEVPVAVVAQDLPLRRGDALIQASVSMGANVPCCSNWSIDQANSGYLTVKIR
jgi:hypothetical protein